MNIYTYEEFLDDLYKRKIPLYNELIKKLGSILKEYVDPEQVKFFYGKNIFLEGEKKLFFFMEEKIVQVSVNKNDINFKTIKRSIKEAQLSHPLYEDSQTSLNLILENGEEINFHSKEDSNSEWNSEYVKLIVAIYKSI
jgi:hypothetical protein